MQVSYTTLPNSKIPIEVSLRASQPGDTQFLEGLLKILETGGRVQLVPTGKQPPITYQFPGFRPPRRK